MRRKPEHLKQLQGTHRPDRAKTRTGGGGVLPEPPAELESEALAEWHRVTPLLDEMGLLSRADRAVLACFCMTWARYLDAGAVVSREGATYRSGELVKRHPAVAVELEMGKQLRAFANDLGLTPRVRQGLDAKTTGRPTIPWEELSIIQQRFSGYANRSEYEAARTGKCSPQGPRGAGDDQSGDDR